MWEDGERAPFTPLCTGREVSFGAIREGEVSPWERGPAGCVQVAGKQWKRKEVERQIKKEDRSIQKEARREVSSGRGRK